MTPAEASDLLTRCAAFDNRQPSATAAVAWASALADVPLDADTFTAVDRFYGTPPKEPGQRLWIQPHDVRTNRRAIRAERLANFRYQHPVPEESHQQYLARYRQQMDAVAAGLVAPPDNPPALAGPPHPAVATKLGGAFRSVPGEDPGIAAVNRPGPLGIDCPKCRAAVGCSCRTPHRKCRKPHLSRIEDAHRIADGLPPRDRARDRLEQEERRVRSLAVLASLPPDTAAGPRDGTAPRSAS